MFMKGFFVKYLQVPGAITAANQSYFNDDGQLCHVTTTAQLKGQKNPVRAAMFLCTPNIKKEDTVYDIREINGDNQAYRVLEVDKSGKVALNAIGSPEITYKAKHMLFKTVTPLENHTWLKDGQEFDYGQADVFIKHEDYQDFMIPYHSETEEYLKKPGYYVFVYFSSNATAKK